MHFMEGVLTWQWCLVWWLVALPYLICGVYLLKMLLNADREALPLPGVTGGFIFILSSLKLTSMTGRCSHPNGTGLSTISFGPWITTVICAIVLLFQSLFLDHDGHSIPGANIVPTGFVGPSSGYVLYAIVEGIALALVFKYIIVLKPDILIRLSIFSEEKIDEARSKI
jgi:cobalt/nickel transport system permease protein